MEEEGKLNNLKVNKKRIEETLIQECKLTKEEKRKLVAEQIFISSPKESGKVCLNGRIYGIFIDQVIFFSKIGKVLGIPVKILRQKDGDNSFNQSLLRRGFSELTGFPAYWDNLQWFLDYVATYMYGKEEGYEYDSFTECRIRTLYNQIDFRLKGALEIALMNYGTDSPNQITPSEYRKRTDNYRKVVLREMDTSLIELAIPISKENSFICVRESKTSIEELEDVVSKGSLEKHNLNICCTPVEKSKKLR